MNLQMFLLVIVLIFALALLCAHGFPHHGLVRSRAEASVRMPVLATWDIRSKKEGK